MQVEPVYRYDIEQNTDDWFSIRVGMFTASPAADLLMDKKTKGYTNLIAKLVEERITGQRTESKTFAGNQFTERGHELEPIARDDYELRTLTAVKQVGVVILNDWVLCSPDGLIGDNIVHQIKCPIFNTQKEYLKLVNSLKNLSDNDIMIKLDSSYYKQLQFELYTTQRDCNIFTSYHPSLSPIDLHVERDEKMIDLIDSRINEAKAEILTEIELIKSL